MGLTIAKQKNIATFIFNWDKHDKQLSQVHSKITEYNGQLIVLAGFMKILPKPFIQKYQYKIINIHPSLLPKYPGLNTHQRVLDNKDKLHGATVHYVNEQLDNGKIVSKTIIKVDLKDTAKSLAKRLLFMEHSLLPYTIGLISQNRVEWQNDSLYFDHKLLTNPIVI